ncbi:hypothetical protein V491_06479 [Pseudogymnoascus sp. VKM F-3775]|nr:hypothetical protein V491_06479 [Pseudogymnoascus sp. VKM F-3775]
MKVEAQTPLSSAWKATQWDPEAILGIINPDRGSFTCMGYAPSMGRRCRNPIAQNNRDFVNGLLELLVLMGPGSRKFATLLEEAAYRSLCWRHGSQTDSIVMKWEAGIDELNLPAPQAEGKGKQSKSHTKQSRSTGSSYTRYTDENVKTEAEDLKQKRQEQDRREAQQDQQRKKRQEEQDKEKRQQEQRDKEARERRQQEQDEEKRQQEQRDKEARERRQQEQDKEKRQQEQRDKEARERRQQEAQKREEREKQAKEQAMKERREWQQAWQNYVDKWAAFRESKHDPSTVQEAQALIPWPVKSGKFGDLTREHVRSFYREACPDSKTTAMFKAMRSESLKWHPDKMVNLYRNCAPGEADKMVIQMICIVVLELRGEAKR